MRAMEPGDLLRCMSPVMAPSGGLPRSPIRSLSEAQRTCRELVGRVDPTLLTRRGHRCIAASYATASLDHLVGTQQDRGRRFETKRLRGLEIQDRLEFRGLHDR